MFDLDLIIARRCQSNQSNAESIERNWTQSNDCDSIAERNRNSIEYYPGFTVRLSNVIKSIIGYYGKFQFDWLDWPFSPGFRLIREIKSRQNFSKLRLAKKLRETRNLIRIYPIEYQTDIDNQSNRSNVENQSNAIERKTPIERNRILPRNWPFDCDSIAFDKSIGSIVIFLRSHSIDIFCETASKCNWNEFRSKEFFYMIPKCIRNY